MSEREQRASVFASAAGVALYTAAAFGVCLHLGVNAAWACLVAAAGGLGIAAIAGALTRAAAGEAAPKVEPVPQPKPEARTRKKVVEPRVWLSAS